MKAEEVNRRRAAILQLHAQGVAPDAIAQALGCGVSTVYRTVASPIPDRRARRPPGLPLPVQAEIRRLWARGRRSASEVHRHLSVRAEKQGGTPPSIASVRRLIVRWRADLARKPEPAETAPPSVDPYADLEDADYALALQSDPTSVRPELALLRSLLRRAVRDLKEPDLPRPDALRIRAQAADLAALVTRAHRALPPANLGDSKVVDWLLDVPEKESE